MCSKLAACLINISEGVRCEVVWGAVRAATAAIEEGVGRAVVLRTFRDPEYNRTVVTVCGGLQGLETAVVAAVAAVQDRVDLREHTGGHPRSGSGHSIVWTLSPPGWELWTCSPSTP